MELSEATFSVPAVDANRPAESTISCQKRFRLTHGDDVMEVNAVDELHARAVFNDRRGRWPTPNNVTCVEVTVQSDPVVTTEPVETDSPVEPSDLTLEA